MATASEISEYDTEELERQLSETRRELFNLRFQLATGQLDNFSRINHVRKDVARMMTELRIREIGEAEGLAMEDLPGHQAAARRRTEDEALGRDKTTASERRAKAKAKAADDHEGHDHGPGEIDEDELAEEIADDDGMARPDIEDDIENDIVDSDMLEAFVEEAELADEHAAAALEADAAEAAEDDDEAEADAEEKS
jgi:large subunit ribosomal protein L29